MRIQQVTARQILDSRGRPTVEADVVLAGGAWGRAAVPSGASTGSAEAHELRDGDPAHYNGLGVSKAVSSVRQEIASALKGWDARHQRDIDELLRCLDGTPNLSRLGANAVLAVSLANARAAAAAQEQQFHDWIAKLSGLAQPCLPLPMTNILSGGMHAAGGMDVQDFLAIPLRAKSMSEAIELLARVRDAASTEARARGLPTLLADEGGLSPGFEDGRMALTMMMDAIKRAGLEPGQDIAIAIDVAATSLQLESDRYRLHRAHQELNADGMIQMMVEWVRDFPVVSIEDALGEEDWTGWQRLTRTLGEKVQLVGDDLFATHPQRLARGLHENVANGVLVKANQNGTLTGTIDLINQAKSAGYATIVSARSGETEDAFMSDLAVGTGAGQIKIGSLRTSSTVAKYNQLLRIAEAGSLPFAGAAALARASQSCKMT
ncbi:MAG: phosphopyruvate hydratase [Burkholderiaceae bacterium]|nr:phosphopyruvate hydratase [Burkholderiaceae bacterium]